MRYPIFFDERAPTFPLTKNDYMKLFIFLFAFQALSCNEKVDLQKERTAILDLLAKERNAHFEKNATLFMSEFADGMISVNRGVVTTASRDSTFRRIDKYFKSVDFVKWDDVVPPNINFAKDGSLAYAIVQKQVILSLKDSLRQVVLDTTNFAWVSIYRKIGDEWKIECNVSTNK